MEKGELILTSNQQDSVAEHIAQINAMTEKFMSAPMPPLTLPIAGGLSQIERSTINNITNNDSRPVEIHLGDTIINGGSDPAHIIADRVREITRENLNQIAHMLRVRL